MHVYDYSFLESFPLPENLTSLVDSLRSMQKQFTRKDLKELIVQEQDFNSLPDGIMAAYEASGAEPLILVPCVALDILCALPQDAGTQGAALRAAQFLLGRSEYSMCRYFLLEEKISSYRYFYQRAFERASAHWEQNGSAYLYYIEMFLSLLYLCAKDLQPAPAAQKRGTKRAAIEALVFHSENPISKAEICAALPDTSPTTVEAVLGSMVRSGRVRKVGASRAARYIRA